MNWYRRVSALVRLVDRLVRPDSDRVQWFELPLSVHLEYRLGVVRLRDGERPFLAVTGDLHPEYHRDAPHALGIEAPHQLLLQLLEQHLVLPHQQKIIDVYDEDDRVLIAASKRWHFLGCRLMASILVCVDEDSGVELEWLASYGDHEVVDGTMPVDRYLRDSVDALAKSHHVLDSVLVCLLASRHHFQEYRFVDGRVEKCRGDIVLQNSRFFSTARASTMQML